MAELNINTAVIVLDVRKRYESTDARSIELQRAKEGAMASLSVNCVGVTVIFSEAETKELESAEDPLCRGTTT